MCKFSFRPDVRIVRKVMCSQEHKERKRYVVCVQKGGGQNCVFFWLIFSLFGSLSYACL